MGTVAPPLAFLLLLLHLAEGSFPEEPSPLSFVPIEGTCVWICVCVCARLRAALMNDSVLDVEIRGQGSAPECSAALKANQHTDAFKMASLCLSGKLKKSVETKGR